MLLVSWYLLIFALGAVVGSFLNVCIVRIPLEKSIFWPLGSHCGNCLQAIRWCDNLPLVSYWWLRGRCRTCGAAFSLRYFFVELLTALGFVGIFYLEVVANIHRWAVLKNKDYAIEVGVIPYEAWVVFGYHAILFSFLLTVAVCDLDRREIPLSVTFTGTLVGLFGGMLWPWPWPALPGELARTFNPVQTLQTASEWWLLPPGSVLTGLYPWPFWGPLPEAFQPGGNWQTGLVTSLVGLLAGSWLLRTVRYLFSKGLQIEALGLGDADLMMMAGSFLGWQPVVVAFFLSVFPALLFGLVQFVLFRDNSLPFGPSLAFGVVLTWLGWNWISPPFQAVFFNKELLLIMAGIGGISMLAAGYGIRFLRR